MHDILERITKEIPPWTLQAVALRLSENGNLYKLSKQYNITLSQLRVIDQCLPIILASCLRSGSAKSAGSSTAVMLPFSQMSVRSVSREKRRA